MKRGGSRGAAVVDFVLIMLVLIPLFVGILQVCLVLYVRNTLASAAAEAARVGATADGELADAVTTARTEIDGVVAGRFAEDIHVGRIMIDGAPAVEVTIRAEVPALGLAGPGISVTAAGHAMAELP